jgi:hypothetical protein
MTQALKAPSGNGVCAQVWKALDRLSRRNPRPSITDILKVSSRKGWNNNNTRVEYYRWRKAHGITGRVPAA